MYAAIPFEYLLCSHGIDAAVVEAAELLHYRQESCRDSVMVLVSRSGESVEVVKLIAAVKGRVATIGVTNDPGSTLAREADISIQVGSLPDEMIAIQSYTGTVLGLILLSGAAVNELEAIGKEVEAVLADLPRFIASSLDGIGGWDEFLEGRLVYCLGRGPSCASAMEGALLFNETAKAPAVGMQAASFRHGPVEVVDAGFSGVIFAPRGRTRELNLALARDLSRFGGQVRVIGPAGADANGLLCYEAPVVPEMLAPIVEIIPVQCAALRLAHLKGFKIGTFRYTPQVTRDEASIS